MRSRTIVLALLLTCLPGMASAERPRGAGGGGGGGSPMIWLEDMVWPGMGAGDRGGGGGGGQGGGWGGHRDHGASSSTGEAPGAAPQATETTEEKPWKRRQENAGAEAGGSDDSGDRQQFRRPEGMGHVYNLRAGSFPNHPDNADYLKEAGVWVMTPDGNTKQAEIKQMGRRGPTISVPGNGAGNYHVFAYADGGVNNGAHFNLYSRAVFMSHGDHLSQVKSPVVAEGPGFFQGDPLLNIEQINCNEREMLRMSTGQKIQFRISYKAQPLANKDVSLVTQQNWRQSKRTDDKGEVSFTLIKEDFPEAGERRRASKYLVIADHSEDAAGEAKGQPFTSERHIATFSLAVYPSRWEWESRSMAYMVIITSVIVSGGAIAIRRRRKRRAK